jgi:hypothetical protein
MALSLSNIKRGVDIGPPRIIIHATKGIGKTTFGANSPKPIFIQIEDGQGTLDIARFPQAKSYDDVMESLAALSQEEHDFSTVVVDSLDWLEPLIWQKVCEVNGKKSIEEFGFGKGYIEALPLWRDFFAALNYLRSEKGMASILIAHTQIKRFDSPDAEPYDRYQLKMHDRASALAQEWADVILFANMKVFTTKTEGGFGRATTRGISTGERVVYTEERPSHVAKNRYQLPYELPLAWNAFADALAASIERNTRPAEVAPAAAA